jgi:peptidoglycan hydrolase-like protein with peptidoglycan-binding domain
VPTTDPSHPAPWLDSLRRSRARRAAAARRLRRWRGARAALLVALACLLFAGGATAYGGSGSAGAGTATRSATIAAVQRALGVPADGITGPQTRRAIRRFQRGHGLTVDGIAGPATLAALEIGAARSATAEAVPGALAAIAACESGGDPTAVSADGQYRGKYQFSLTTWRDLGGTGDPAAASEAEQDRRAAALYAARGTSPWPTCA